MSTNENVQSYNVGKSDYSKHKIQPWDIWKEYNLNPWDADIVKRVLRSKEGEARTLDYEKSSACKRGFLFFSCFLLYLSMAKKSLLDSGRFSELIQECSVSPHKIIIKRMNGGMFPFDMNVVLNYKPHYLAAEEFKRCIATFKNRNSGKVDERSVVTRYAGILKLVKDEEVKHRKALEPLAIQTIKDLYQVPDYVNLQAIIS